MVRLAAAVLLGGSAWMASALAQGEATDNASAGAAPPPSAGAPVERWPAEPPPPETMPADSFPPDGLEQKPFSFRPVRDGYLRFNNQTGQLTFCSKRTVGWVCQLAPDERGVLESEIARLLEENAALKRDLSERHAAAAPEVRKATPPTAPSERSAKLPNDPNIDQVKELVEKMWQRLVNMIARLQNEVLKKS